MGFARAQPIRRAERRGYFPAVFCLPIAMFPFWEHTGRHENYRLERAVFVRRKASGDEGAAPSLEDVGQERQMEFDGRGAFRRSERKDSERGTCEVRNRRR